MKEMCLHTSNINLERAKYIIMLKLENYTQLFCKLGLAIVA